MIDTTTAVKAPTTPLRDLGLRENVGDPNANDLDKDAFLQLLVAQLRYQDPLNPNDPSEFMATTAQFTVVEKLDELTKQGANTAIISGLSMASSLVGRTVTYMGSDDTLTSGVVSSAQVTNGEVRLVTDSGVVDLSTVVGIGESASQQSSSPGSPTTPAPTATPTPAAPTTAHRRRLRRRQRRPPQRSRPKRPRPRSLWSTRCRPAHFWPLLPHPPSPTSPSPCPYSPQLMCPHRPPPTRRPTPTQRKSPPHDPFHVCRRLRTPGAPNHDGRRWQQHRQRQHQRLQEIECRVPGHTQPDAQRGQRSDGRSRWYQRRPDRSRCAGEQHRPELPPGCAPEHWS